MTDDVLTRAEPWLTQCGPCDFGIHTRCTCPLGDYRPVMLALVEEIQRLRQRTDNIEVHQ